MLLRPLETARQKSLVANQTERVAFFLWVFVEQVARAGSSYRFNVSSLIGGGGLGAGIYLGIGGATGGSTAAAGGFFATVSAAAPNSWYGGRMWIIQPFRSY